MNRYVGNLAPMPGVFPDYPAPVIRNTDATGCVQSGFSLDDRTHPPPMIARRPSGFIEPCLPSKVARPGGAVQRRIRGLEF